jgi:hypothetical protein
VDDPLVIARCQGAKQAACAPLARCGICADMPHFDRYAQVGIAGVERDAQRQAIAKMDFQIETKTDPARAEVDDRGLHVTPRTARPASSPGNRSLNGYARLEALIFGLRRTVGAKLRNGPLTMAATLDVIHVTSIG